MFVFFHHTSLESSYPNDESRPRGVIQIPWDDIDLAESIDLVGHQGPMSAGCGSSGLEICESGMNILDYYGTAGISCVKYTEHQPRKLFMRHICTSYNQHANISLLWVTVIAEHIMGLCKSTIQTQNLILISPKYMKSVIFTNRFGNHIKVSYV